MPKRPQRLKTAKNQNSKSPVVKLHAVQNLPDKKPARVKRIAGMSLFAIILIGAFLVYWLEDATDKKQEDKNKTAASSGKALGAHQAQMASSGQTSPPGPNLRNAPDITPPPLSGQPPQAPIPPERQQIYIENGHFLPPSVTGDPTVGYLTDFPPAKALEPWPCTHARACEEPGRCNLSTGNCEPHFDQRQVSNAQTAISAPIISMLSLEEAMADDMLLIEGDSLYMETQDYFQTWQFGTWNRRQETVVQARYYIGGRQVPFTSIAAPDETRLAIRLADWMNGEVLVTFDLLDQKASFSKPITIKKGTRGIIACQSSDPIPAKTPGQDPNDMGPYGAGYVDVHTPDPFTRIYYPAQCGGMRRPPAKGPFPLAIMLHGNGATHINYSYLTRLLSSWGYVVITPYSTDTKVLKRVIQTAGQNIGSMFGPLAGLTDGGKVVLIGHSRGSERVQALVLKDMPKDSVAGAIYLGPVRPTARLKVPTLLFAASGDPQGGADTVYALWKRQISPSHYVFIKGGNHSQFTDVRHWEYAPEMDSLPHLSRNDQFVLVQAYSLMFMDSVFGRQVRFPSLWAGMDTPSVAEHYRH